MACEFSGIVRDAFIAAGHDAVSCDLLPSERPGPHIQADIINVLMYDADRFDAMVAHPPCRLLCNSGVRWLYGGKGVVRDDERWAEMEEAARFFFLLLSAPIPRVAVENPIMHRHAGIEKPTQIIQPWQYGHPETKATGLWLRNLPALQPTDVVDGRTPRVHHASPGPDRWKERSRTLPGIAKAMAEQWGNLC